jgi:hypothetical protein
LESILIDFIDAHKVSEDFEEKHELSKTEPEMFEQLKRDYLAFIANIPNMPVVGPAPLKGAPRGQRW